MKTHDAPSPPTHHENTRHGGDALDVGVAPKEPKTCKGVGMVAMGVQGGCMVGMGVQGGCGCACGREGGYEHCCWALGVSVGVGLGVGGGRVWEWVRAWI